MLFLKIMFLSTFIIGGMMFPAAEAIKSTLGFKKKTSIVLTFAVIAGFLVSFIASAAAIQDYSGYVAPNCVPLDHSGKIYTVINQAPDGDHWIVTTKQQDGQFRLLQLEQKAPEPSFKFEKRETRMSLHDIVVKTEYVPTLCDKRDTKQQATTIN